jgi:hypothetical protein
MDSMADRKSQEELMLELEKAKDLVEVGATYLHYKKGDRYQVTDIAINEATGEATIVYAAQYGDEVHFTRALSSWVEEVETEAGLTARFVREY